MNYDDTIYDAVRSTIGIFPDVPHVTLTDDQAIKLAHEMAGLSSAAEVYEAIAAGNTKIMGRKLVIAA